MRDRSVVYFFAFMQWEVVLVVCLVSGGIDLHNKCNEVIGQQLSQACRPTHDYTSSFCEAHLLSRHSCKLRRI